MGCANAGRIATAAFALIFSIVVVAMDDGAGSLGARVERAAEPPQAQVEPLPTFSGAHAEMRTVARLRHADDQPDRAAIPHEQPPKGEWIRAVPRHPPLVRRHVVPSLWHRGPFTSVQVNVDGFGRNIPGDAANEPSIAIDPTIPCKMAIGWRQFDSVESDFRQAGVGYSQDAGETWTFPGSLTPGIFGSDPVLASSAEGVFYYISINFDEIRLFRSFDGGITWIQPIQILPQFVDKPWMIIDTTGGTGDGHIYLMGVGFFDVGRSIDRGLTFQNFAISAASVGTMDVDSSGNLYQVGDRFGGRVFKFNDAQDSESDVTIDFVTEFDVIACMGNFSARTQGELCPNSPNFTGLSGQPWIAVDRTGGATNGFIYVVGPGGCPASGDPLDIVFVRSTDGGFSFAPAVRINDDPSHDCSWQWFWTMSLAPSGRIDVVWNDTRRYLVANLSKTTARIVRTSPGCPVSPGLPWTAQAGRPMGLSMWLVRVAALRPAIHLILFSYGARTADFRSPRLYESMMTLLTTVRGSGFGRCLWHPAGESMSSGTTRAATSWLICPNSTIHIRSTRATRGPRISPSAGCSIAGWAGPSRQKSAITTI